MLIQSPGSAKDNFRGFSKEELNTTNEKMEQQQQHLLHIKRLLSTAAAGTGIIGDLDAQHAQQQPANATPTATTPTSTSSTPTPPTRKAERNLWRSEEIKEMLTIMQETNALDLLNDKMIKSESVFYDIEKLMHRRGYNKKTHNQIWTKWKFLKSTYMTSRRNAIIPKMIPGEIYLLLHKMLGNGSDLIYTPEDSSNACSLDDGGGGGGGRDGGGGIDLNSNADEDIEESCLITTSAKSNGGVSGGGAGGGSKNERPAASVGMAHPIFGFRLGMVKTEPADTGYETTANNSVISENDSLENSTIYPVGFSPQDTQQSKVTPILEIKPEPNERVTDSPASIEPLRGLLERSSTPENDIDNDNLLLVPREKTTSAMTIRPLAVKQKVTPTRAPPLRIATFAKEANIRDNNTPATSELPPPPLRVLNNATTTPNTTNTTTRQTTEVAASSSGSVFAVSPAITIPTSPSRGSILRLPRDVTLQLRTNYKPYNDNTSYQTNYALRDEGGYVINRSQHQKTTIPQTQISNQQTQPQYHQHQHQQQHEQPMTSQMAKLRASILNKKRRLEIPTWQENELETPAKKQQKRFDGTLKSNLNSSSNSIRNNSYYGNKGRHCNTTTEADKHIDDEGDDDDDDDDYDDDDDDDGDDDYNDQDIFDDNYDRTTQKKYKPVSFQNKRSYEQPIYKNKTKAAATPTMSQTTSTSKPTKKKNRTPAEEILKDMAMSLRQSQLQMVNDFFEQQMDLARKEHEFQMEQDRLMMSAFKKQTQQLMKAAQKLFGESESVNGSGSGSSFIKSKKKKPSEKRLTKQNTFNKTNKKQEHHKIANTRHVPSTSREVVSNKELYELISSDSDDEDDNDDDDDTDDNDENEETELQENVDADPLLAAFDPTQFVTSELVDSNDDDENDEEET